MAVLFNPAPNAAVRMLREIIAKYRTDLEDVKIGLYFATSTDKTKPAMKSRGRLVAGRCKVNSIEDRAEGKPDVSITIDGDNFGKWSTQRQRSVIHHEISHVEEWDGKPDIDDRPKLSSRYGDWDGDGFHHILEIYGADSFEYSNVAGVLAFHRQLTFAFAEEDAGDPEDAEALDDSTVTFRSGDKVVTTTGKKFRQAVEEARRLTPIPSGSVIARMESTA